MAVTAKKGVPKKAAPKKAQQKKASPKKGGGPGSQKSTPIKKRTAVASKLKTINEDHAFPSRFQKLQQTFDEYYEATAPKKSKK